MNLHKQTNACTPIIKGHSRNNDILFLSTLAADLELKRTGFTNDVIRILHSLLRALDTERRKRACRNVITFSTFEPTATGNPSGLCLSSN